MTENMITYTSEQQAALREAARLMRDGAKLRPQCFYAYYGLVTDLNDVQHLGSCALGAIYEAHAGFADMDADQLMFTMIDKLNSLEGLKAIHPVLGYCYDLEKTISNLNDSQDWSREKIADWLERLATS